MRERAVITAEIDFEQDYALIRAGQRKAPRVLPRRRRKAFTYLVPRGCRTHFRSQINYLIRCILIARASKSSLLVVAEQIAVGWKSDDDLCCRNGAGCPSAGYWHHADHSGYFRSAIRGAPVQPVANAAKSIGEFSRRCRISVLLVVRRTRN